MIARRLITAAVLIPVSIALLMVSAAVDCVTGRFRPGIAPDRVRR